MEEKMITGGITTGLIGAFFGGVTVLLGFLTQKRRGDIDESALVLGEWKKLIDAHQTQIGNMVQEVADLRSRLSAAEKRITELEEENRGLKLQILQSGRSTVHLLGQHPLTDTLKRAFPPEDE